MSETCSLGAGRTPSPSQLWASSDPAVWTAVKRRYAAAVEHAATTRKTKASLPQLDCWYRTELSRVLTAAATPTTKAAAPTTTTTAAKEPATTAATAATISSLESRSAGSGPSSEPHITRAQLEKLVEWKLARGQWRPRLLAFARDQPDEAVEAASRAALAALRRAGDSGPNTVTSTNSGAHCSEGAVKAAVEALTVLKGVGPATASALLAAAHPAAPFMSDEALETALPSYRAGDYSVKAYLHLTAALQAKAAHLSAVEAETAGSMSMVGEEEEDGAAAKGEIGELHEAAGKGVGELHGAPGAVVATGMTGRGPVNGDEALTSGGSEVDGDEAIETRAVWDRGGVGAASEGWSAREVERCLWVAAVLCGTEGKGARAGEEQVGAGSVRSGEHGKAGGGGARRSAKRSKR